MMKLKFYSLTVSLIITSLLFIPFYTYAETNLEYFFGDSKKYEDVLVEDVLSADTIRLADSKIVVLIGLKAPDAPRRRKEVEFDQFGFPVNEKAKNPTDSIEEESYKFAQNLLKDKHVRLEFDVERNNPEFKTLAYVFLKDKNIFANAEILRQGYANLHLTPANKKYEKELRQAYREAKEEKRGLQNE